MTGPLITSSWGDPGTLQVYANGVPLTIIERAPENDPYVAEGYGWTMRTADPFPCDHIGRTPQELLDVIAADAARMTQAQFQFRYPAYTPVKLVPPLPEWVPLAFGNRFIGAAVLHAGWYMVIGPSAEPLTDAIYPTPQDAADAAAAFVATVVPGVLSAAA